MTRRVRRLDDVDDVDDAGRAVARLLVAGPLKVEAGWVLHVGSLAGPLVGGGRSCVWTRAGGRGREATRYRRWET